MKHLEKNDIRLMICFDENHNVLRYIRFVYFFVLFKLYNLVDFDFRIKFRLTTKTQILCVL